MNQLFKQNDTTDTLETALETATEQFVFLTEAIYECCEALERLIELQKDYNELILENGGIKKWQA